MRRSTPSEPIAQPSAAGSAAAAPPSTETALAHLLHGLRRGAPHGAETNLSFLCDKFTSLSSRLQTAQFAEREAVERRQVLRQELAAAEAETNEEANRRTSQELQEASETTTELAEEVSRVELSEKATLSELAEVDKNHEFWSHRKSALEERCVVERSKLALLNDRLRTSPERSTREKLVQAQATLETLRHRREIASKTLETLRTNVEGDEAQTARAKSEARAEEDLRNTLVAEARRQRQELDDYSTRVATAREELMEVGLTIERTREDADKRASAVRTVFESLQNVSRAVTATQEEVQEAQHLPNQLESARAQLQMLRRMEQEEQHSMEHAQSESMACLASSEDWEAKLGSLRSKQLAEACRDQAVLRAELGEAEAEHGRIAALLERCRKTEVAESEVFAKVKSEVTAMHEEVQELNKAQDLAASEHDVAQTNLRNATPVLAESRRRVKHLEQSLETAKEQASSEWALGRKLERETTLCQDKMKQLREENVRLAEHCASLEHQLPAGRARGGFDKVSVGSSRGPVSHRALLRSQAARSPA